MKRFSLRQLCFMALCCDLGMFSKKLILPAANLVTDALHIPGGIGTGFSLLFITAAAALTPRFGSAAIMGAVQSGIALALGSVGSMGALAPLGYILPGIAIDLTLRLGRGLTQVERIVLANLLSSLTACLTANAIVFRLQGAALLLYAAVAALSGALCGLLAAELTSKLTKILQKEHSYERKKTRDRPHRRPGRIGRRPDGGASVDPDAGTP